MAESELSNVQTYGTIAGLAVAFLGAAGTAVFRWIKSLPEPSAPASHIVLEEASLADTKPLYILLERNVTAVEKAVSNNSRIAIAVEEILKLIDKRLEDDEIDRKANERAQDRFERMKSDYATGERGRRRDGNNE